MFWIKRNSWRKSLLAKQQEFNIRGRKIEELRDNPFKEMLGLGYILASVAAFDAAQESCPSKMRAFLIRRMVEYGEVGKSDHEKASVYTTCAAIIADELKEFVR